MVAGMIMELLNKNIIITIPWSNPYTRFLRLPPINVVLSQWNE